ncbi:hypothetical protein PAXRUDRAFT_823047 [Paxillus rubicundulus Ve08.2h10]|uniref:Uncharacterized protein n=1 Tax=Paxillus rubicundulus Ve08.2h10 TaxID=930991 RepID=A0A0D0ECC9_9AGAM|nr:hypothetical protein PAXRUDRAFT_823047 [Paxillus rubicundulus Ve08.2h10]
MVPVVRQFAKGACLLPPPTKQMRRPSENVKKVTLAVRKCGGVTLGERGRCIIHAVVCTRNCRDRVHTWLVPGQGQADLGMAKNDG